jgi:hypothetical protein
MVRADECSAVLNYIVLKSDKKDQEPNQILRFTENGCELWFAEGKIFFSLTLMLDPLH